MTRLDDIKLKNISDVIENDQDIKNLQRYLKKQIEVYPKEKKKEFFDEFTMKHLKHFSTYGKMYKFLSNKAEEKNICLRAHLELIDPDRPDVIAGSVLLIDNHGFVDIEDYPYIYNSLDIKLDELDTIIEEITYLVSGASKIHGAIHFINGTDSIDRYLEIPENSKYEDFEDKIRAVDEELKEKYNHKNSKAYKETIKYYHSDHF